MRVALFSDIHGHITGLKAVLAHVDRLGGADITYALGDFVGGGPGVEDVLDLLLARQVRMIRGNWDEIFIDLNAHLTRIPPGNHQFVRQTLAWLTSRLSPDHQALLANLPLSETLELSPTNRLFLCHAAPQDAWARVCQANTPIDDLRKAYGPLDAQVIAYGHYHQQHILQLDHQLLINVASVGLGWQGLSSLTLLEDLHDKISIQQYQVPYDFHEHTRLIRERGMPDDPAIWYW